MRKLAKRLLAFAAQRISRSTSVVRVAITSLVYTAFLVRWLYVSKIVRFSVDRKVGHLKKFIVAICIFLLPLKFVYADELAEFLFWDTIGTTMGDAVQHHSDYQRERRLWRERIAAAKVRLDECGGCESAKAELEKWQKTENQFQEIAGSLGASVGMPREVAGILGITPALVPMRSKAEREKECAIKEQDWALSRPEFCREAVNRHLECLRSFEAKYGLCSARNRNASDAGNRCWDTRKLFNHCANENYEAFDQEVAAQSLRRANPTVPEYLDYRAEKIVIYPHAGAAFVPPPLPVAVVKALFKEKGFRSIQQLMPNRDDGALAHMQINLFHWNAVAPTSECFTGRKANDEITLRVCEDLSELTWHWNPLVISCRYRGVPESLPTHALYWYSETPDAANPDRLLQRSQEHPVLRVGNARTTCPNTAREARMVDFRDRLRLVSLGVDQIPAETPLPRSKWQQEQQRAYEERQVAQIRSQLAEFPIAGYYQFAAWHYGNLRNRQIRGGGCLISASEEERSTFDIACRESQRKSFSGYAKMVENGLLVEWKSGERLLFSAGSSKDTPILSGHRVNERNSGYYETFLRQGAYTPERFAELIAAFKMEDGRYDMKFTHGNDTLVLQCDLGRQTNYVPNRFNIQCIKEDGTLLDGVLIPSSDNSKTALEVTSWYPNRPSVGSQSINKVVFPVAFTDSSEASGQALEGYANDDIQVRFFRLSHQEDLARGTPLHKLPELNGGWPKRLRERGIHTLEQFAALTREEADLIGFGYAYRYDLARRFLGLDGVRDKIAEVDEQKSSIPSNQSRVGSGGTLTGTWVGSYTCAQGLTALELTLQETVNGLFWGTNSFSPHPSNPSVPSGSFYVVGAFNARNREVRLQPGPWIKQPAGYLALPLVGTLMPGKSETAAEAKFPDHIKGNISGAGCREFLVKRAPEKTHSLGEIPEAVQLKLDQFLSIDARGDVASIEVSTDKAIYSPGERVLVNFRNSPGNQNDWITIVPIETPDGQWKQWYWLKNKSGSLEFSGLPAGQFEVRIHLLGTENVPAARFEFTVASK